MQIVKKKSISKFFCFYYFYFLTVIFLRFISISTAANYHFPIRFSPYISPAVVPYSTLLLLHLSISLFPVSADLPESSSFSLAAYCPPCTPPFFRLSLWLILASSASVSVGCTLHPSTLLPSPLTLPLICPYIARPCVFFTPFPSSISKVVLSDAHCCEAA